MSERWRELEPLPSRELLAFVAAVEAGGLGAAAGSLSLTQSAVTKRIQSLERRLGTKLLRRSHDGVTPTAAGRALYPDAKEGLAALARASASVLDHAQPGPRLRLAASHTTGEILLPRWLAAVRIELPALRSSVAVVNSTAVLSAVEEGEADIGLLPGQAPPAGLESIMVGEDRLVAVVAPRHRWAAAGSVAPSQLASESFFARERGSHTRALAVGALRAAGVELAPELELNSTQALKRTVMGGGYTIISQLAFADEADRGELHALPIRGVDLSRSLYAVRRPGHEPPAVAHQLWSWLAARARPGSHAA